MDKDTLKSLQAIIDYLYNDERKDMEASDEDMKGQHIFNDILAVQGWIDENHDE